MPKHNPLSPLSDATHEAYVQQRARGVGPSAAAAAAGCANYRGVERHGRFKARLLALTSTHEPTITLDWLVRELKQTVSAARAANQFKNANEALEKLVALYNKYPKLRGDGDAAPAAPKLAAVPETRDGRRAANQALLSRAPEAAANE